LICEEVQHERRRQDKKWGQQNHPDGTGGAGREALAEFAKQDCQDAFARGEGSWRLILREEIAEAMAEDDPVKLRAELIQSAAVIVAWVQCIDRRAALD
jgi:hypothetical protein